MNLLEIITFKTLNNPHHSFATDLLCSTACWYLNNNMCSERSHE